MIAEERILTAIKELGGKGLMAQIYELVKDLIPIKENLQRLLNTMYRRGILCKEFVVTGTYRASVEGIVHKKNFVWSVSQ